MKFLDAELRPITLRTGLEALVVAFVCGLLVLGLLAAVGRPLSGSVTLLAGLTTGSLAAAAGISALRSPKAFSVVVGATLLMFFAIEALVA